MREGLISAETAGVAEILWRYHCIYDAPEPCDVIVGLGSYDLRVADRCAELFIEGHAGQIIFTGAAGNWTRNLYPGSEAAAFADRAIAKGVPVSAILLEEQATNIGENIAFSALLAGQDAGSAILVTKPQTQRRCHATAAIQWSEVRCITTAPMHGMRDQPTDAFPLHHLIHEMVGDLARILSYPERGFQTPQHVPAEVLTAYETLVSAGFTGHLPS